MLCNVLSKDRLKEATMEDPIEWDAVSNFTKSDGQSEESYCNNYLQSNMVLKLLTIMQIP